MQAEPRTATSMGNQVAQAAARSRGAAGNPPFVKHVRSESRSGPDGGERKSDSALKFLSVPSHDSAALVAVLTRARALRTASTRELKRVLVAYLSATESRNVRR